MAERRLNELIALELGWKYVGLCDAERSWQSPDGEWHDSPLLFDADWAATGVLLDDCSECETVRYGPCIWGATITLMDQRVGKGKFQNTLTAAIAASYLAALEVEVENDDE